MLSHHNSMIDPLRQIVAHAYLGCVNCCQRRMVDDHAHMDIGQETSWHPQVRTHPCRPAIALINVSRVAVTLLLPGS